MSDEQIKKDLVDHMRQRLTTVLTDYRERCEDIGITETETAVSIGSVLVNTACSFLALVTTLPSEDAAGFIAKSIDELRSEKLKNKEAGSSLH